MKTLFLGGTTDNTYRERLTNALLEKGVRPSQIFNPVVEHWDEAARQREDEKKADPNVIMLYYLRANENGDFLSFYSMHEAEMGLYDDPDRTFIVFDNEDMKPRPKKRFRKVYDDLRKRFPSAPIFETMEEAFPWLVLRLKFSE